VNLYNCTVRLGGNLMQTVPKHNVTQPEIRLLRAIHGADGVADIGQFGEDARDERTVHLELAREYGRARVEKTLGVSLDDFDEWLEQQLQDAPKGMALPGAGVAPKPLEGAEESVRETRARPRKQAVAEGAAGFD
jgi:hypothetical protein